MDTIHKTIHFLNVLVIMHCWCSSISSERYCLVLCFEVNCLNKEKTTASLYLIVYQPPCGCNAYKILSDEKWFLWNYWNSFSIRIFIQSWKSFVIFDNRQYFFVYDQWLKKKEKNSKIVKYYLIVKIFQLFCEYF